MDDRIEPLENLIPRALLTVAALLLIAVSIGWLVTVRLIAHNLRRGGIRVRRYDARRDLWNVPPP